MPNDLQSASSQVRAPDTDGGSAAADLGLGLPPQETERRNQNAGDGKDGQQPQDNPQSDPGDEEVPIPTTYPTA